MSGIGGGVLLSVILALIGFALMQIPQYHQREGCKAFQGMSITSVGTIYASTYHDNGTCTIYTTGGSPQVLSWDGDAWIAQ